ncbi:hypothetical protein GOV12_00295 [Candidatus Pacearchaeota archaeon]|nr:hypothetical protein [Candidatus Pacearchaeota archaeon]
MTRKTRDGLKLRKIVCALEQLAGVVVRHGSNHPYVAFRSGYSVPCPVATSTDVRKMVVPWVKHVTDYSNSREIYRALSAGRWE